MNPGKRHSRQFDHRCPAIWPDSHRLADLPALSWILGGRKATDIRRYRSRLVTTDAIRFPCFGWVAESWIYNATSAIPEDVDSVPRASRD